MEPFESCEIKQSLASHHISHLNCCKKQLPNSCNPAFHLGNQKKKSSSYISWVISSTTLLFGFQKCELAVQPKFFLLSTGIQMQLYDLAHKVLKNSLACSSIHTVTTQILRRRSNFRPEVFGAVAFKFETNMTVVIKYLSQKVDFWSKNCQVPF